MSDTKGSGAGRLPRDYYLYLVAAIVATLIFIAISLPPRLETFVPWLLGVLVGTLIAARASRDLAQAVMMAGGLGVFGMVSGQVLMEIFLIDMSYGVLAGAGIGASERLRRSRGRSGEEGEEGGE